MYVINISIIPDSEYFMGDSKSLNISLECPGLIRTPGFRALSHFINRFDVDAMKFLKGAWLRRVT